MTHRWTVFLLFLATIVAPRADAQAGLLTYEQALERARSRAPLILAAQDRIEEARGRLLGAKVLLRDNPLLSFSGGPRYTPGSDLIDSEVGLSQSPWRFWTLPRHARMKPVHIQRMPMTRVTCTTTHWMGRRGTC